MRVIECQQYDLIWWMARRGVPTASEFDCIITPKERKLSAQADKYIDKLIGDLFRVDYAKSDDFTTPAMRRGSAFEDESRRWYCLERNTTIQQVGFITTDDGRFGCSPDSLVGDDGLLELKNPLPHTHVSYLLNGGLDDKYKCQIHGQLVVTGRDWVDIVSYYPGFHSQKIIRVFPDDFTEDLKKALDRFWDRYQYKLKQIKEMS